MHYRGLIQPVNHYYNSLQYILCSTLKHTSLKIYLPEFLIILFKSNNAWNRVCWSIHGHEICPKILFDFDKFCAAQEQHAALFGGGEGVSEQLTADNYKSKHTWWPYRPKVFLISQMWSTLPGVFSPSLYVVNCLTPPGCLWQQWWSVKQVSAPHFVTLLSIWSWESPR